MQINFTFRHMDASEAIKTHVANKLARFGRYEDREMAVDTTFRVEKLNKTAEFRVIGAHGTILQTETRGDLYEAIDVAIDKLDRQLSRAKSRRKNKKGLQATTPQE